MHAFTALISISCGLGAVFVPSSSHGSSAMILKRRSTCSPPILIGWAMKLEYFDVEGEAWRPVPDVSHHPKEPTGHRANHLRFKVATITGHMGLAPRQPLLDQLLYGFDFHLLLTFQDRIYTIYRMMHQGWPLASVMERWNAGGFRRPSQASRQAGFPDFKSCIIGQGASRRTL